MEVETMITKEGNVIILEINGPMNINTSIDIDTCINKIIEGNNDVKLLIDLKGTTFVSSSGLRVFLSTSKKMKSKKFPLVLCSLNTTVQEVFSISGFNTLINVTKTREEALTFLEKLA